MSLTPVFFDGFDTLTAAQSTRKWATATASSFTPGRIGGNAAVFDSTSSTKELETFPYTPGATWCVSFALYITAHLGASEFFEIKDGSTVHLVLKIDASRRLVLLRGSGGTVLATGTNALSLSSWYSITIKFTIHDSTGNYYVALNSVSEITANGVDTRNGGNATADRFRVKQVDGSTFQFNLDDFAIGTSSDTTETTDLMGDVHVYVSTPSGAGSSTDWLPSSGSNYAQVSDAPADDDSSYVESLTPGDDDLYTFDDLSITGTIKSVGLQLVYRVDDAGTRTLKALCKSDTTTSEEGSTITPGTSYAASQVLIPNDPDTTAPWDLTGLNAAEFGVRLKT